MNSEYQIPHPSYMPVFARRVKIVVKYFLTLKMMREQSEHVIIIDKRKSQQKDYDKN